MEKEDQINNKLLIKSKQLNRMRIKKIKSKAKLKGKVKTNKVRS